jgi:hypothetical protein
MDSYSAIVNCHNSPSFKIRFRKANDRRNPLNQALEFNVRNPNIDQRRLDRAGGCEN